MNIMHTFQFFSFLALTLLCTPSAAAEGSTRAKDSNPVKGIIGAIIDESSRIGKEERVAMEIAKEDFYSYSNQSLALHIKDSQGDPVRAALAAKELIGTQEVKAILGLQTWEEVSVVADTSSQNQVPILSFADTIPKCAAEKWPFLLQASPNKHKQMKVIAAIVQSWNWHQVTVLYEESMAGGVIPHLYDALREVGAEIRQVISLSPFAAASSLSEDLETLQREECRVFIVHTSLSLAARLFERANKLKMMETGYVWIITDPITSLVHSVNASIINSMQGIVGVKSYFPETGEHFQDFYKRFRKRFSTQYPDEDNNEPGIFAVQAYDACWTMALAINETNLGDQELLATVLHTKYHGLSGNFQFNHKVAMVNTFQIINIMGKSYRELGFWSNDSGFSKTIGEGANYSPSMNELGQVFWPGAPQYTPRGWSLPTSTNPLRIGVPVMSGYTEYVNVQKNHLGNNLFFSGFAIDVFYATLERLPFYLPYNFIPFNGTTYDELVKQIHLKNFDAVVGDVSIVADRYKHAEFTQPYTETGLMLIVPTRSASCNAWLFMKPFTKSMWALIAAITVYNGFAVWLIERNHCNDLRGSLINQIGVMLCLSFTTLFSLHGEKLHSNLSRMSMVVWLFVALVITQTYTANLASVLTVQRLEPTEVDNNSMVGYCSGSFNLKYLVEVLRYDEKRLRAYSTIDEYAEALKNKEIAAVFLEASLAKMFFGRYCKGFMQVGPTYKVGGFGFAFPRGSPLLASMNEALLKVSESGKLRELENGMLASNKCRDNDMELEDENPSLGPDCFRVLFITTGATSSLALVSYILVKGICMLEHKSIWKLMLAVMKRWRFQKKHFTGKVSNADLHGNSTPDALHPV